MSDLINGKEPDKIFIGDKQIVRKYMGDKIFYQYNAPSTGGGSGGHYVTYEYQWQRSDDHGFFYIEREISPNPSSWGTELYANNGQFPNLSASLQDVTNQVWVSD
ncbi:hypothetical protein IWT25_02604 [Secundilactobacillus pentosiphilus]|uniref:Uncharacterized protein n=1 Tax=Secundilactobacillus pentosiphilus TaxID=1714682 RepID=A0A1Z5IZI6_9LACO|nr:hypothetical protein [Secundilactobacillus pentosiphilus]GAX07250.1 hypothetical protein IWT25_02604 [Secundilactobacillus pentosiphilus]